MNRRHMKRFSFFLGLAFLLLPSLLFAEDSVIWLPFGDTKEDLGADLEDGEEWFPVLFALDGTGSVHVPDFYKGRVAVYDREGSFVREVPAPELVSPRMNLFGLGRDGNYFSFGDFAFVSADATGKIRWSLPFPIGTMVEGAVATDDAVYLIASGESGQVSLRVPNGPAAPRLESRSRKLAAGTAAVVRNKAGYEVCFRLADELATGKPFKGLQEDGIDLFNLAFLGNDGTMVWVAYGSRGYNVIVADANRRVTDRYFLESRWLRGTYGLHAYSFASAGLAALSGGSPKLGLGIVTVRRDVP